jgi:hypothetical protein
MRMNGRMIWKVRPTPSSQTWCGFMPSTLRPSSSTSPALGARKPFSRLNAVVLPAPLGPMMPRIMPLRTWKPTSSTALRPPKFFDRPRASRIT